MTDHDNQPYVKIAPNMSLDENGKEIRSYSVHFHNTSVPEENAFIDALANATGDIKLGGPRGTPGNNTRNMAGDTEKAPGFFEAKGLISAQDAAQTRLELRKLNLYSQIQEAVSGAKIPRLEDKPHDGVPPAWRNCDQPKKGDGCPPR